VILVYVCDYQGLLNVLVSAVFQRSIYSMTLYMGDQESSLSFWQPKQVAFTKELTLLGPKEIFGTSNHSSMGHIMPHTQTDHLHYKYMKKN